MLVFEVMISSSEISKDWMINGNVDERKIGPKTSEGVIMGQIFVQIKFQLVGRREGLSRQVELTYTVAGKIPAND